MNHSNIFYNQESQKRTLPLAPTFNDRGKIGFYLSITNKPPVIKAIIHQI
jgi:hypothetical protein